MTSQEYLQEPIALGNPANIFPIGEVTDSATITVRLRNEDVGIVVKRVRLSFGGGLETHGIITERIYRHSSFNAGNHQYYDEARAAENAVAQYCDQAELTICRKVSSWPYAIVVVQPKHARA